MGRQHGARLACHRADRPDHRAPGQRSSSDGLPNEDAKSLIFDDTNLFEVDKFSGYDRIETGTRANVGLQYTFQANGGGYARILAGQSYPAGRRPTRTPIRALT